MRNVFNIYWNSTFLHLYEAQLFRRDLNQSSSSQRLITDHKLALCTTFVEDGLTLVGSLLVERMSFKRPQDDNIYTSQHKNHSIGIRSLQCNTKDGNSYSRESMFLQRTKRCRQQRIVASPCTFREIGNHCTYLWSKVIQTDFRVWPKLCLQSGVVKLSVS